MRNFDEETQLDVPTMMKMLMTVYNNIRDDEIMDEVAEAVGDAVCMLGDMRRLAEQVLLEDPSPTSDVSIDLIKAFEAADPRKMC